MQFCHGKGLPPLHEKSYSQRVYNYSVYDVNVKNSKTGNDYTTVSLNQLMHKRDTDICRCPQDSIFKKK
jgi:hypothetical protein